MCLVSETSPLPATLFRHYLPAQEKRGPGAHGAGRPETTVHGPRLGRGRRTSHQREIKCTADLRRLGSVLARSPGMSVQAGIWNFDGPPVDRRLLGDFSESLKQQGPDGESCYIEGSVALLYRPFHTTAESRREKQPYFSPRGFILTWDGRLDNRDELIAEFRRYLEPDPSDVAIVAAAFDHWETTWFRRIIGDWAVSIWKPEDRELVFATDYMSIRHIFYYLKKDRIWWSTDLSPLVLLS